ncbi:ORF189 [White spot syndrome virus]|uniref:ORF189 n=1 Tax=White spot syndrome virus TaxID=342409 RepID=A0A2D3I5H0_9VIRU|nr:ORF189 [White spot syndrome virus]
MPCALSFVINSLGGLFAPAVKVFARRAEADEEFCLTYFSSIVLLNNVTKLAEHLLSRQFAHALLFFFLLSIEASFAVSIKADIWPMILRLAHSAISCPPFSS